MRRSYLCGSQDCQPNFAMIISRLVEDVRPADADAFAIPEVPGLLLVRRYDQPRALENNEGGHTMANTILDSVGITQVVGAIPFVIVFFVGFGLGLMAGGLFKEQK